MSQRSIAYFEFLLVGCEELLTLKFPASHRYCKSVLKNKLAALRSNNVKLCIPTHPYRHCHDPVIKTLDDLCGKLIAASQPISDIVFTHEFNECIVKRLITCSVFVERLMQEDVFSKMRRQQQFHFASAVLKTDFPRADDIILKAKFLMQILESELLRFETKAQVFKMFVSLCGFIELRQLACSVPDSFKKLVDTCKSFSELHVNMTLNDMNTCSSSPFLVLHLMLHHLPWCLEWAHTDAESLDQVLHVSEFLGELDEKMKTGQITIGEVHTASLRLEIR